MVTKVMQRHGATAKNLQKVSRTNKLVLVARKGLVADYAKVPGDYPTHSRRFKLGLRTLRGTTMWQG